MAEGMADACAHLMDVGYSLDEAADVINAVVMDGGDTDDVEDIAFGELYDEFDDDEYGMTDGDWARLEEG